MVYLDNAATSYPKPTEVYEEVLRCMESYGANPGRASHDMAVQASNKIMETRELLSELFNIQNPLNVILTSNATEALNLGIKGILRRGDHVISTVIEHNSVLRPLNFLSRYGVSVTLVGANETGFVNPKSILREIRNNTKLIVAGHASNVLGTIQHIGAIGKIARENGIYFMVDASQSAGIINIDVDKDNIDLLAFSGHKGLMGPQGTGALYIREGIKLNELMQGGTGSNSNFMSQPDFMPDKFESGTLNTPGYAGLCQGLKFIKTVGRRNIQKHEEILTTYLLNQLKKMPYVKIYGSKSGENRSPVVSINLEGFDCSEVGYFLNKKGIAVRTGYHCAPLVHGIIGTYKKGTVRISPGYFNTYSDIEKICSALMDIYKGKTPNTEGVI